MAANAGDKGVRVGRHRIVAPRDMTIWPDEYQLAFVECLDGGIGNVDGVKWHTEVCRRPFNGGTIGRRIAQTQENESVAEPVEGRGLGIYPGVRRTRTRAGRGEESTVSGGGGVPSAIHMGEFS